MSETQIEGTTTSQQPSSREQLSAVKARITAHEANPNNFLPEPMAVTAATPEQMRETPVVPQEKPVSSTTDGIPQKLRDKDGQVSEEKILKANEHLEKAIPNKEARIQELLKKHKELEKKFTQTSQEARKLENTIPTEPPPPQKVDFNKQFLDDLASDPVGAIDRRLEMKLQRIENEIRQSKLETSAFKQADELNSLVEAGNDWIINEGLGRFEKVFEERPYLRQSPTPYLDAARFMDPSSNNAASGNAQPGRGTPILASGSAALPPSSDPSMSTERAKQDISDRLRKALQHGDKKEAAKLISELDKLERGY